MVLHQTKFQKLAVIELIFLILTKILHKSIRISDTELYIYQKYLYYNKLQDSKHRAEQHKYDYSNLKLQEIFYKNFRIRIVDYVKSSNTPALAYTGRY